MLKSKRLISIFTILAIVFTMTFASTSISSASSYNGKYWLKVNTQCNVVTAYKKNSKGSWVAVRAMLTSTGVAVSKDTTTPKGTFYTNKKWRWASMMGGVYAQYCTQITKDILFHSVYYYKKGNNKTQSTAEFNKLGKKASHGCVRLSTMDAKWVYDNCKKGTKVTVYKSSNPGPLGKPKANKAKSKRSSYWDPTDPDKRNPFFTMQKPTITVSSSKALVIQQNSSYDLKASVSAKDPNTNMSLTSYLKVSSVYKYSSSEKKYVKGSFSTKSLGTYRINYYVKDPYGRSNTKTITINVVADLSAPTISGATNKDVVVNDTNAVVGVTASQKELSRTSSITTYITEPGSTRAIALDYNKAKAYKFTAPGRYIVTYVAKNAYTPYRKTTKSTIVMCHTEPKLDVPEIETKLKDEKIDLLQGVTASQDSSSDLTDNIAVEVTSPDGTRTALTAAEANEYQLLTIGRYTVTYSVKNPYRASQVITVVKEFECTD